MIFRISFAIDPCRSKTMLFQKKSCLRLPNHVSKVLRLLVWRNFHQFNSISFNTWLRNLRRSYIETTQFLTETGGWIKIKITGSFLHKGFSFFLWTSAYWHFVSLNIWYYHLFYLIKWSEPCEQKIKIFRRLVKLSKTHSINSII